LSRHFESVNRDRNKTSNLLDKTALKDVSEPLTSYKLNLVMREWQETKKLGERIAKGEEEAAKFNRESGY
jgi:hypothetical protein